MKTYYIINLGCFAIAFVCLVIPSYLLRNRIRAFFCKFIPHLDANINLGFIRIQTILMCRSYEFREFRYIALNIWFFKWNLTFSLYSPDYFLYQARNKLKKEYLTKLKKAEDEIKKLKQDLNRK